LERQRWCIAHFSLVTQSRQKREEKEKGRPQSLGSLRHLVGGVISKCSKPRQRHSVRRCARRIGWVILPGPTTCRALILGRRILQYWLLIPLQLAHGKLLRLPISRSEGWLVRYPVLHNHHLFVVITKSVGRIFLFFMGGLVNRNLARVWPGGPEWREKAWRLVCPGDGLTGERLPLDTMAQAGDGLRVSDRYEAPLYPNEEEAVVRRLTPSLALFLGHKASETLYGPRSFQISLSSGS
jgi:hypothetical protein